MSSKLLEEQELLINTLKSLSLEMILLQVSKLSQGYDLFRDLNIPVHLESP